MYCIYCGDRMPDGAPYCKSCGMETPAGGRYYCRDCAPYGAEFCQNCGTRVGRPLAMAVKPAWRGPEWGGDEAGRILAGRVADQAVLFDDMLFEEGSVTCAYVPTDSGPGGAGGAARWRMPLPEALERFSYRYFDFIVKDPGAGRRGGFDGREQTLTVAPGCLYAGYSGAGADMEEERDRTGNRESAGAGSVSADGEAVILHEMIHLHEFVIDSLPRYYHDVCSWSLYHSLLPQIPDLDARVEAWAHSGNSPDNAGPGGGHDLLFVLKSFDLDLKKGYEPGTVLCCD